MLLLLPWVAGLTQAPCFAVDVSCCRGAGQLDQAIFSLTTKVLHHESLAAAATEKSLAAAKVEHEVQLLEMQTQMQQQEQQVEELQEELEQVRGQHVVQAFLLRIDNRMKLD